VVEGRVGVDGAVDGDDGQAAQEGGREVVVLAEGGDDDEPFDVVLEEGVDELAFAVGAFVAAGGEEEVAAAVGDVLDAAGDGGVEGVAEVAGDEADEGGGLAGAKASGLFVAAEAEVGDGLLDAGAGEGVDGGLVVHDSGNRLGADAGDAGDVVHGGTAAHAPDCTGGLRMCGAY